MTRRILAVILFALAVLSHTRVTLTPGGSVPALAVVVVAGYAVAALAAWCLARYALTGRRLA